MRLVVSSRRSVAKAGLLASALSLHCGAPGPAATGVAATEAVTLTYGWGIPCRVPVVERSTTEDATIQAHYTLDLQPSQRRAGEAELRKLDLELDAVGGSPASEAHRAEFREAAALAPVLRIGRDGAYLGFADPAQAVEHALTLMVRTGGLSPDDVPAARQRMLSAPELIDAAASEAGEDWDLIVGGWLGVRLAPGETKRAESATDAGGVATRRITSVANRGVWPGTTLIVIERQTELPPDSMRAIAIADATEQAQTVDPAQRMALLERAQRTSGRSATWTRIATEPRTLRSLRLEHSQSTEIVVAGEPPMATRVSRQLAFDWDHAVGCRGPVW